MNSQKYKEAVERYSAVLSRNPRNVVEIFIKRSKAQAMSGLWDKALNDADEVCFIVHTSTRCLQSCIQPRL